MYKPRPEDIDLPPTRSIYIDLKGTAPMNERHERTDPASTQDSDGPAAAGGPTLAEDLLLLLFQPDSGTIAGEGTLYYVLAGAVLADLGLGRHVQAGTGRTGGTTVTAVVAQPPMDDLLHASWEYLVDKPRGAQTVLAAMGPTLRQPLLDRLLERGDIRRVTRKRFGLFETSALEDGGTGRRDRLIADIRAVLVDGAKATPRIAALAALLYTSGTLPQFYRDIPWNSAVVARAEEFKAGNWGAGAVTNAVTRTFNATIINSVAFAAGPRT